MSRTYSSVHSPRSSTSVSRMARMRDALISARPPTLIASSTTPESAARTSSHVGNLQLSAQEVALLGTGQSKVWGVKEAKQ